MPFENGVNWLPQDPDKRGRHASLSSALEAALKDMVTIRDPFYDSLADNWKRLFPELPMRPGRYDGQKIWLYVRNAPLLYAMRPKLAQVRRELEKLPGAPEHIELRLEIHSE